MNDKAYMQTKVNKNGNSSAAAQTQEKVEFNIKNLTDKMGFLMFDGFQDNIMKSSVVEKDAAVQDSTDKTIYETSNAATGGPDPEMPEGDDEN